MTENKQNLEFNWNYPVGLDCTEMGQNPKSTDTIVTGDYCVFCWIVIWLRAIIRNVIRIILN